MAGYVSPFATSGGSVPPGGSGGAGSVSPRSGSYSSPFAGKAYSGDSSDATVNKLNDIVSGKSSLSYSDQIKAVNDGAKAGVLTKDHQMALINQLVDNNTAKNTPAQTPLDMIQNVVAAPAVAINRLGTALGDVVSNVNGTADKEQANKNQQDQNTITAIKSAGKVIQNPNSTPQQKAQAKAVLGATMTNSANNDAAYQQHQSDLMDQVDPVKNAAAVGELGLDVASLIPGVGAAKAGLTAAELAAKGGAKAAIGAATKDIVKNTVINTGISGTGGALDVLQKEGVQANPNDVLMGAAGGAAGGAALGVAGGVVGKVAGKYISKFMPKEAPPTAAVPGEVTPITPVVPTVDGKAPLISDVKPVNLPPESAVTNNSKVSPLPFGETAPGATVPPTAPSMLSKLPAAAEGDVKAAPLANQYIHGQYDDINARIQAAGDNLNKHDTALIPQIESAKVMTPAEAAAHVETIAAKADNPKAFKDAVATLKEFADARLANDQSLGRDMNVKQNYLPRFYERPTGEAGAALDKLTLKKADQLPGYTKDRVIATQEEANALAALKNPDGSPKFPQLKLKNENVFQDAHMAVQMAKADHGRQAMIQALEQAHPGVKIGNGNVGYHAGLGVNYKPLNVQGAKGLTAPEHLANFYNKRATVDVPQNGFGIKTKDGTIVPVRDNEVIQRLKETDGQLVDSATGKSLHSNAVSRAVRSAVKNPLQSYDTANANLKYSILGGGTFHAIATAGTVGGQQITRALTHPLQIPGIIRDNSNLIAGTVSKTAHDNQMAKYESEGSLGFARMAGITLRGKDIASDANVSWLEKAKSSNANPIKAVHDMVFDRQIPQAKMMIMRQQMLSKFKDMNFNNPTTEQVNYARKFAGTVNGLGGINRAVEGLSPVTAKRLSRVLLATDFTEGKFRILGDALNPKKINTPAGNIARQMVIGKSIVFAVPGLTALTIAGKLDWSNPDQVRQAITDQLLDPSIPIDSTGAPTKSNPQGTNQAIHFPSTFISELGKIIKPALDPLAPNKFQGALDYATNRSAAAIGVTSRMIQNKDFFGNPIYGQDKSGNNISPLAVAGNIANQVSPIPLVQGAKTLNGQGIADSLLNVAGLRVSSDAHAPSGQHSAAVGDYYNTINSIGADRSKVVKQINTLLSTPNNTQKAVTLAQNYNDSIAGRLQPFKDKYSSNYNPAWDTGFKALPISVTNKSISARVKGVQQAQKVISPNY